MAGSKKTIELLTVCTINALFYCKAEKSVPTSNVEFNCKAKESVYTMNELFYCKAEVPVSHMYRTVLLSPKVTYTVAVKAVGTPAQLSNTGVCLHH